MKHEYIDDNNSGKFFFFKVKNNFEQIFTKQDKGFTFHSIFYNKGKEAIINVDGVEYKVPPGTTLPLAYNQSFKWLSCDDVVAIQFNRDFYCIINHDAEIGCVGFLFFGPNPIMLIEPKNEEKVSIDKLYELFLEELNNDEDIKGEMLRMALAKLIILNTRIAKKTYLKTEDKLDEKFTVIRNFNLLVEIHFKKEHSVAFYADKLNKSPKTLSNTFTAAINKSPLQLINDRIINEAKRFLYYTDKSIKEIAMEIGFENANHFSKFYKKHTSFAPKDDKINSLN